MLLEKTEFWEGEANNGRFFFDRGILMIAKSYVTLICFFVLVAYVLNVKVARAENIVQQPSSPEAMTATNEGNQNINEIIALQQQRIQSLQAALIEQDIRNQRDLAKLQDTVTHQQDDIKKIGRSADQDTHVSIMLTIMGAMIGLLALVMAVIGFWGYAGVRKAAATKADEVVRKEIGKGAFDKPISEAGQKTLTSMLNTGAFNLGEF